MVLQFMWRKDFLCTEFISRKLCRFLLMFLTGFTSLSVWLLFPLSIIFFVLCMELIDLVNPVMIFLSQMILPRWLIFLLGFLTMILTVLLIWSYFFLLMQVFVLQWLYLHWEILMMLLSQFPLTFYQTHNKMPRLIA